MAGVINSDNVVTSLDGQKRHLQASVPPASSDKSTPAKAGGITVVTALEGGRDASAPTEVLE